MKKIITLFVSFLLIFTLFNVNCLALYHNIDDSIDIIYLDNGDYMTIEVTDSNKLKASNTASKQKTLSYYSDDDEIQWRAVLDATFSYTGYSASCTNAQISYTIYNSNWSIPSATAIKSGNTATGTITAKYYFLGVPINTIERSITITCSPTGVLS